MPIFRERNSETAVPCLGVWCDGTYAAVAVGHAFYPSGARFECMLRLERMLTEQHADLRKNFRSSFKNKNWVMYRTYITWGCLRLDSPFCL